MQTSGDLPAISPASPAASPTGEPGWVDGGVGAFAAAPVDAGAPLLPDASALAETLPEAPEAALPIADAPLEAAPLVTRAGEPSNEPSAEVTVVGTRFSRTAGSAHVIGEKQLQRFEYDDPTAVLMQTPGLYVRTEDGLGLRPNIGLRGVNPERSKKVTLLEDGVLLGPAPYSAPAGYYFPMVTRMTKVRVIKGPAAIGFGPQTVAGAVDFITRSIPDELAAAADVAVGQYGYGKAHVYAGGSTARFGVLIEGVRLQTNGFKELLDDRDTGFARNEWMIKGQYLVDPRSDVRNELRLKLTYSDEVSNESYLGISDADFERNPNLRYPASQLDRMENYRTSVVLTHLFEPSPNFSLTTNVYRHDFHRTWRKVNEFPSGASLFEVLRNPGGANTDRIRGLRGEYTGAEGVPILIGPNRRDFTSAGVESRLRWDARTGVVSHRLEAGARYHFDQIERQHSQNRFTLLGEEIFPTSSPTEVTSFAREWTHAVALHLAYAITVRNLTLTPGVRSELVQAVSRNRLQRPASGSLPDLAAAQRVPERKQFTAAVLPGVGLYYELYRGLGVLGGVYRGFSPPPPPNRPATEPNAKPERSVNYEAGARYTRGMLRTEAVWFYNDYQNLTNIPGLSSGGTQDIIDQQFDAGKARIYGLELLAEHELPIAKAYRLPVLAAYTFSRGQFADSFRSGDPIWGTVSRGDDIPYLPRHQLRAQLGFEHPRAGINAAILYVAPMREEPGTEDLDRAFATERQILVDLAAHAKLWGPLSLYFNIQNLFDSQYIVSRRPFGARPNAPRWTHVGLRAAF